MSSRTATGSARPSSFHCFRGPDFPLNAWKAKSVPRPWPFSKTDFLYTPTIRISIAEIFAPRLSTFYCDDILCHGSGQVGVEHHRLGLSLVRVWLLHVGELLPGDEPFRPFRYSYLAKSLLSAGHEVVRWAPTFVHAHKRYRAVQDATLNIEPRYTLELLNAGGYRRNVGFDRILFNLRFARKVQEVAPTRAEPDIIVAGIPSPEVVFVATRYGVAREIPVVVDVRDLWPDVLLQSLPAKLRRLATPTTLPWRFLVGSALRNAAGITAVSQGYLDWGLSRAGRAQSSYDRVFPLGYSSAAMAAPEDPSVARLLADAGVDPSKLVCSFSGQFERSYDLETVVDAAALLSAAGREDIQFVLCGDGAKAASLKKRATGLGNIIFLGWVGPDVLAGVLRRSQVGLAAYAEGALQGLPNKPAEYFAAGLAVASSLGSELEQLLREGNCGVTYKPGDAATLAALLVQWRDNPEQCGELRGNSLRLAARFDIATIYPGMVTYLEGMARQ